MSRVFVLGYGTLLIIIILLLIIRTESPFMKLSSLTIMLMLESFFAQAKVEDRFNCQTDEDCQVRWTDSVCIERNLFGSDVRQCAPHRQPIKPACRGVSFGLCPAYQSPSRGHLNLECVFQKASSLDLVVVLTSGNGNNTNVLCEPGNISSRCVLAFPLEQQNISHTIVGQFQCVDVTTCGQRSVFPDTCRESDCRDDDVGEVPCNERDTCTPSAFDEQLARHTNKQCLCQTGFSGSRCETIAGPECDVSCGEHGECVAGECVCDEKWHADVQCETCSSDAACVHGTCGEEGTCVCEEGYTEKQCDTPEHRCVDLTVRIDCRNFMYDSRGSFLFVLRWLVWIGSMPRKNLCLSCLSRTVV